ncbi:hypothetical protein BCR32DRAFT_267473 [Anaeromyces robustus]|uniref:Bet v1-like protein n=1 Tax=Anaeromyces robustus TaxID=1754192 RepID=A0A1Y1XAC2_9FUNG|nr:hypothetical protein BCR32DRAFT_267473 [Anaeromyces robustus]|eukprot:ORX82688.1 hypothetical protein BCR32DRAFT_267473 [Anaeromyces robustus]
MVLIEFIKAQLPILLQVLAALFILSILLIIKSPSYFKGSFSRSYNASIERIWLIISDRNIFREHRKALELVDDLTDKNDKNAKKKWKEYSDKGSGYIIYQINNSVENSLLEVEMIESSFHMRAKFTYNISKDPDDDTLTLVTVTEESNINNLVVKIIMSIGGRGSNARRDLEIIENELNLQHEVYEEYKAKLENEIAEEEKEALSKKDK